MHSSLSPGYSHLFVAYSAIEYPAVMCSIYTVRQEMNYSDIKFYDKLEGVDPSAISELSKAVIAQLTADEIDDLTKRFEGIYRNPPSDWKVSLRTLPQSYIELLKHSNGGGIENGDREIGFFGFRELREYLLEYQFPDYMPGCLPFGLNGGGVFYIFDMRSEPESGEYPILVSHASDLDIEEAVVAAKSLEELITDNTNVEDLI